jgi:hypothetical protein
MTRDEIIRMAREAGLQPYYDAQSIAIERFFAKAYEAGVTAEREVCALVCEGVLWPDSKQWAQDFAAAIRARGEK